MASSSLASAQGWTVCGLTARNRKIYVPCRREDESVQIDFRFQKCVA